LFISEKYGALDEAHNVEKKCEESVSIDIRSTDVALCIQEIAQMRYQVSEGGL
jgi:regulator of telomere elongation helicase 1